MQSSQGGFPGHAGGGVSSSLVGSAPGPVLQTLVGITDSFWFWPSVTTPLLFGWWDRWINYPEQLLPPPRRCPPATTYAKGEGLMDEPKEGDQRAHMWMVVTSGGGTPFPLSGRNLNSRAINSQNLEGH